MLNSVIDVEVEEPTTVWDKRCYLSAILLKLFGGLPLQRRLINLDGGLLQFAYFKRQLPYSEGGDGFTPQEG
eukprot:749083-Hanusia_phi.AAC.1